MENRGKIIIVSFFVLFFLIFLVTPILADITQTRKPLASKTIETISFGYKIANISNFIISADNDYHCAWKPDLNDNGYKICEPIVEIENQNEIKPIIYPISIKFDLAFQNNKTPIIYYFSNTFTTYNASTNELSFVERKVWNNWKDFSSITNISTDKSFAIKAVFEIPKYEGNHYNFQLETDEINLMLDPNISKCGNLNVENSVYTLNQSVSSSNTCFIINAANNVTLNCNGFTIDSPGSLGSGVQVTPQSPATANYETIMNCNIYNYTYGISLREASGTALHPENNTIKDNIIQNTTYGIYLKHTLYNTIIGNIINRTIYGIYLEEDADPNNYNNITQNTIQNSSSAIFINGANANFNNIWNNIVYDKIFYTYTNNNSYVISGIENIYLGDAVGPTSSGLYIYNNLKINSNQKYISSTYYLPNGISFVGSNLILDCNNSNFIGSKLAAGITIFPQSPATANYETIMNCNIYNYTYGISLREASGTALHPENNTIKDNRLINNTYGIYLKHTFLNSITNNYIENNNYSIYFDIDSDQNKYNNITENIIINNYNQGVYIVGINTNHNNIWKNKFVNNNASDSGSENNWNLSDGGNYWNMFDAPEEGCTDNNYDLICDVPYNITGLAGSKDFLPLLGPIITDLFPIQVIKDVDLVKGKTTLVRSTVKNIGTLNKDITINVYFDENLIGSSNYTINSSEQTNFDFYFIPNVSGNYKEIKAEVKNNG